MSHPSWVRGLKLICYVKRTLVRMSHPSWVRGLKLCQIGCIITTIGSHPSWVRGLKHSLILLTSTINQVAPLVGAWIETVPLEAHQ